MAKYLIEDTTLTAIADAIRGKDGTTDKIQVNTFADRIASIETGGDFPQASNGQTGVTATAANYAIINTYFPDAVSVTIPTRVVTATSAAGELQT